MLTEVGPGTAPWLCSFVDWGKLCGSATKIWIQLERPGILTFFRVWPNYFPGWRTEYILLLQEEEVSSRLIPLLPLWSCREDSWWFISRKEPPSSWVHGICISLSSAEDSYLHIWHAIKMPFNTFYIFCSFLTFSYVHREWMNIFVILAGVDLIQLKECNPQLSLFPEIQNIHFAVKTRWYLLEWYWLGLLVALCQLVCCSSTLPCICTHGITALAPWCCKPAQAAPSAQRLWSSHCSAFMGSTAEVSGELCDGRSTGSVSTVSAGQWQPRLWRAGAQGWHSLSGILSGLIFAE